MGSPPRGAVAAMQSALPPAAAERRTARRNPHAQLAMFRGGDAVADGCQGGRLRRRDDGLPERRRDYVGAGSAERHRGEVAVELQRTRGEVYKWRYNAERNRMDKEHPEGAGRRDRRAYI